MRKLIFISSGILFVCVAAVLVIIGAGEKDNIMIIMSGMAIPFLFVGFWNIYSVFYEKRFVSAETSDDYFTYRAGLTTYGVGAFYNKKIIVPVFIILFGTVVCAIGNSFLVSSRSTEDIGIAVLIFSFLYALVLTIYFLKQLNKEIKESDGQTQSNIDDIGFKVAFFFATVATLGLFALGWWIYKKLKTQRTQQT